MFSGVGFCSHPKCFPQLGASTIIVYLCETHCRHMLCYEHWLTHQTTQLSGDSSVNQMANVTSSPKKCYVSVPLLLKEEEESLEETKVFKEIEWWNEITPWKNTENLDGQSNDGSMNEDEPDGPSLMPNSKRRMMSRRKHSLSSTYRTYCGVCPLTFDGAFGLTLETHDFKLCSSATKTKEICLYQHFRTKHGFTSAISIRLIRAMIDEENPYESNLFSSSVDKPAILFDPFHKVKCPLSTSENLPNTPCLTPEISRKSIRRHLLRVHRLDSGTVDHLIKQMMK